MKKKSIRDTPVIVIPKGYTIKKQADLKEKPTERNVPFSI